ncbi:MAG: hypothetical protein CML12_01505 [Puniceicoccaceae bacterium]|nr:hypothetical protein [Puniceicoccaceae bacterium]
MGNGMDISESGDFTIIGKVSSKLSSSENFGYALGNTAGVDVAWLQSKSDLENSPFRLGENESAETNNTFRIFRHDYGHVPATLLEGSTFVVDIPAEPQNIITQNSPGKNTFEVRFDGTGIGATGVFNMEEKELLIIRGGYGYALEPQALILDDQNNTILPFDPSWLKVRNGTDYLEVAKLRDLSPGSLRGLRGIKVSASQWGSRPFGKGEPDFPMNAYWLSYRRTASQYGLTVLLGPDRNVASSLQDALLDMTAHSTNDFSDAFLMPGFTYSDYDTDVHITTISHGGVYPMEFLDVVINVGTVESNQAAAPAFDLKVSNKFPSVGEFINITAQLPNNQNLSDYAFSWYTNEIPETQIQYLNQSSISKSFNKSGEYVIRVVVSDLKGGIASSNLMIKVGDYQESEVSSISGTVRSKNGMIQGARVMAAKAPITEHYISAYGAEQDLFMPSGFGESLKYSINGKTDGNLVMRRGEVHRFYFEPSISGYPLTFWEQPEGYTPQLRLKMLSTPRIDKKGTNYRTVPSVKLIETSGFANYVDDSVGTIEDFQKEGLTLGDYIIQRPLVKAIMEESNISSVAIRPAFADPVTGNLIRFGGSALSRSNAPKLSIGRLSFWEDYSKPDATLVAYVDGVNTVSPVNGKSFLAPNWLLRPKSKNFVPDLVVWGTGSKGCFEVTIPKSDFKPVSTFTGKVSSQGNGQVISISNQGFGWEPNGTMAVLHYPYEPIAYWTFDRHESLFDDSNQSRFQPSPAWLRNIKRRLANHWAFEEEDGTYIFDKITDNNISMGADFNMSDESRWAWGAKGRALELNGTIGISFQGIVDDSNFTFSSWFQPFDDFTLTIGGQDLEYDHASGIVTYTDEAKTLQRLSGNSQWMHLAFVKGDESKDYIYLDGQSIEITSSESNNDVSLSIYNGLLDEVQYFESAFTESIIKEALGA